MPKTKIPSTKSSRMNGSEVDQMNEEDENMNEHGFDGENEADRLLAIARMEQLGYNHGWASHPDWGPREVADALRQSARDLGEAGPDTLYGWGLVDAIAASGLEVEQPEESVSGLPFPNPALVGGAAGSVVYFPLQLSVMGEVSVRIFDLSGALVAEAVPNQSLEPGDYRARDRALRWDGRNDDGQAVPSGIYIYRLESTGLARIGKIAVVRSR